jgi:predicted NBD/HSP70 family sugar kinase
VEATDRVLPSPTAAQVEGSGQLLELIRRGAASTVSEMATAMGVARSTIIQRLELLSRWDFVVSEMKVLGTRGRPAAVSRFNPRAGVVLAAQLGLTGFRAAVTDLEGTVLADRFQALDVVLGPEEVIAAVHKSFDALLIDASTLPDRVVGVGVGTPSSLELRGYSRSRGLEGVDWSREFFERALLDRYRVPVRIDLDVNLLALAEQRAAWPDAEVLVCLKLGTLIDASLVVRGVPIRGASRLAGELGHIKVSGNTTTCSCGTQGCLDAVASGSALVRQLSAQGFDVDHVSQVVRLANDGVPEALTAVRGAGRHIGEALSSVVNLLNPAAITTWGYLTESEALFAGIRETLYGGALPASSEGLQLVNTSLGALAGVRGAAMHVIDEVLSPYSIDRAILSRTWDPIQPDAPDRRHEASALSIAASTGSAPAAGSAPGSPSSAPPAAVNG